MELFRQLEHIKHTLNLMNAALPFVDTKTKISMEVAIRTGELMESIQNTQNVNELSACDMQEENVDMESLLLGIQSACNSSEKEFVNILLNFMKAQNLYHTYQTCKETQPPPKSNDFVNNTGFKSNNMTPVMDLLLAQLNPEQKDKIDTFQVMLQAMNNG